MYGTYITITTGISVNVDYTITAKEKLAFYSKVRLGCVYSLIPTECM